MDANVKKLNCLRKSAENFKEAYNKLLKNSKEFKNINYLGTTINYPFMESFDKLNITAWINDFTNNIDDELIEIFSAHNLLLDRKEASEYLSVSTSNFDRKTKKYRNCYKNKGIFVVKADKCNSNKVLYTKEFCDFIKKNEIEE